MKTPKTNLSKFLYLNLLIPLTWYLISISHILPSLVHSLCLDHAVAFVLYLHTLSTNIFLIIFLVDFICLFLFNPSFYVLFMEFPFKFSNFHFHFCLLIFFTHTVQTQQNKTHNKQKTSLLYQQKTDDGVSFSIFS